MQLGPYLLLQTLGEGSNGTVYRAYDRRQGRTVALKLLRRPSAPEWVAQLEREAAGLHLKHPNILELERVERLDDGRLLLMMPLLAGKTLEKLLVPVPLALALSVVRQAAAGLAYAHAHGVLHCDIKPANLMLVGEVLKILDFGLSRPLGDPAQAPVGTLEYMSPEAAQGRALGLGSDLWSLGVVFYELLTGRSPFAAVTSTRVLRNVAEAQPPPPSQLRPGLPKGVDVIAQRLLSRAPEGRYGDADALLTDLAALAAGAPLTRPSPPPCAAPELEPETGFELGSEYRALPPKPEVLLGREDEGALLALYLRDPECRLLTLQGLGGVGKTHLSVWLGYEQHGFTHVHFVALAEVRPEGLGAALAGALGAPAEGGVEAAVRAIGQRKQLLIVDNFEHLKAEAHVLETLLGRCPNLSVLVTSRERLGLPAEWVMPLQGLAVPEALPSTELARSNGALALFERRAAARGPFELSAQLSSVWRICQRVQGHPLTLAAGLVEAGDAGAVAARLEAGFALPEQGSGRHRSLQAVFRASCDLLDAGARELLAALALFEGGAEAAAIAAVTGADEAALAPLLGRSLLGLSLEGRYLQHPMIHSLCRELLPAPDARVQRRYRRFYGARLRQLGARLRGPTRNEALADLRRDLGNLRAALTGRRLDAPLAEPLRLLYTQQGRYLEGLEFFAGAGGRHAQVCAGWFALLLGDLEGAAARSAPRPSDRAPTQLLALNTQAGVRARRGDAAAAKDLSLEALALARELADAPMEAACLSNLVLLEEMLGEAVAARRFYEKSLALSEAQRNHPQTLTSLNNLAVLQLAAGEVAAAKALLERGLLLSATSGASRMKPLLQSNFGLCLYAAGDPANAEAAYLETYRELQERGERATAVTVAAYLGQACAAQGRRDEAYGWLRSALRDARELGDITAQLGALVRVAELVLGEDRALGQAVAALASEHPLTDADDRALARRLAAGAAAGPPLERMVDALLAPAADASDYRAALGALQALCVSPS